MCKTTHWLPKPRSKPSQIVLLWAWCRPEKHNPSRRNLTADGLLWYNTNAVGAVSALVIASGWSRVARLTSCCKEAKDAPTRQGQSSVWRVNRQIDLGSSAEGSVARYTLPTEEIKTLRVAHSIVPHKNIIQSTSCQTEVALAPHHLTSVSPRKLTAKSPLKPKD